MQLPGQLQSTTLGDVLGALHRERATGVLRLSEPSGACHEIRLCEGAVESVRAGTRTPRLGDVLRHLGMLAADAGALLEGLCLTQKTQLSDMTEPMGAALVERCVITEAELKLALKAQNQHRLERVYAVRNARLSFHIAGVNCGVRATPLDKAEFLNGRPRARDMRSQAERKRVEGVGGRQPAARRFRTGSVNHAPESREEALSILELERGATLSEIRAAFRRLASKHHPDLAATKGTSQALRQRRAQARFARLSAAYHMLVA